MDNKVTKRRLSDFLAYEWILTIVAIAIAVIVLELVYTVCATRVSVGQNFKFYFDEDLYSYESDGGSLYDILGVEIGVNGKTFSYDVLEVDSENLVSSYNVLSVRLSVQEGDVLFTSAEEKEDGKVRAKSIIDEQKIYDMEKLLDDAKTYLKKFLKSGETDVTVADNMDEGKIVDHFNTRMKGDNRFRTEAQKAEGRQAEIGRIKKLSAEVADFERLLTSGREDLFYRYTKYAQAGADDETKDKTYERLLETETAERPDRIYGFNLGALTGGSRPASDFFKITGKSNSEGVVLLAFDFLEYQPELQFETISFINVIIRTCSNFLD